MEISRPKSTRPHARRPVAPGKSTFKLTAYEWMFVLMGASIPLEPYQFRFVLGWSADRVLLGLLVVMLPIYMQRCRKQVALPQVLSVFGIGSVLFSLFTGAGLDSYAIQYMPSMLQGYVLFAVGSVVLTNNPRALKIFVLIALGWSIICGVFSVYMLYYYYVAGSTHVPMPFLGYVSDESLHMFKQMRSRRLFMPFPSPPHLGALCGFLAVFFMCIYLYTRRLASIILSLGLMAICVLTLSRGPVLMLLLTSGFLMGFGTLIKAVRIDSRIVMAILSLLVLGGGIMGYRTFQMQKEGKATSERLSINVEEIQHGRHLELRLAAFKIFAQGNPVKMLGGQGFGAFEKSMVGAYSFASYLTLLVEIGLLGASIFTVVMFAPVVKNWTAYGRTNRAVVWYFYGLSLALFLAGAHFLYELKSVRVLWLCLAFVYGLAFTSPQLLETASSWILDARKRRQPPRPRHGPGNRRIGGTRPQ